MMRFDDLISAYRNMLANLLPRGRAWTRAPSSMLMALLSAIAVEFARLHQRAENLINEADPSTTLELLEDWERNAGLPDDCLPTGGTTRERQNRVLRKITGIGGQNKAYFIELAAQLGITIEIDEFDPMRSGMRTGLPVYDGSWQFAWLVRVLSTSQAVQLQVRNERLRSGVGRAGDRLRSFSVNELECIIRRSAPAHTQVLFSYPADPEPILWFDFLSDFGNY